jgi:hypothetical protein
VCLPIVTWLTGVSSRALCLPAVHPWRDPCRRVSGDGMRVEPSLMHHEGGSWTAVRTHTPSKLSKVQRTFVSHPLGLLQVSGERITASSELIVTVSVSISSPVAFSESPRTIAHAATALRISRTSQRQTIQPLVPLPPVHGSPVCPGGTSPPRVLLALRALRARAR